MFDVFISYPHQDKTAADAACAALEATGVRCWIAPRDVEPGAEWAASIMDAIEQCRVMVLIFSGNANRSKQVQREVQNAFDRDLPVIPLRVEDVVPAKALTYYMGPVHWLDALTPPLEQHLERLARRVTALLSTAPSAANTQDNARNPQSREPVKSQPAAESSSILPDKLIEGLRQPFDARATQGNGGERPDVARDPTVADKPARWPWSIGQSTKREPADVVVDQLAKLAGKSPTAGAHYDLFISHAVQDAAIANTLCADFEKRGVRCWIAPRDIARGDHYATSMLAAIGRCRAMLLIFSANTNTSEHVLREVELAVHDNIPILPLRIDKVEPTGGFKYLLANKPMLG